ncbi:MAG TPA: folate family ECF transporter S component [Eubacteriaceae bacterium]|nr:folate family ECF transporter S component [Eubacteriaceae bacterium]
MNNTRSLVFIGVLISIEIILTRFFAIETAIIRIGFGFIAVALTSILFGPIIGGIAAAIADVLGMIIFPKGPYFPGFTLSAFLGGITYGVFLYNRPKSYFNIAISVLIITIFVNIGLNTLWISIITGKAYLVLFMARIIKEIIIFPIQIFIIYFTWKYMGEKIQKKLFAL